MWVMRRAAALTAAGRLAATLAQAHGSGAGEPATASAATTTVEVEMFDAGGRMGFKPDRVEVESGTVVKFIIHNRGAASHEFVLGDSAENAAHARMMRQMPDMKHDDPNAKTLDPGATASLAWRFTHRGEFEFACLLPGHYEAGMHGVVIVK
jgi:uncharacterized cupredoxin-like copper-binding protein